MEGINLPTRGEGGSFVVKFSISQSSMNGTKAGKSVERCAQTSAW